jgi:hypothetical protein
VNALLRAARRPTLLAALVVAAVAFTVPTLAAGQAGRITIVSPKAGATISGSTLVMKIKATGFDVTDQATRVRPNEGHFHVFLDKRPFVAVYGTTFRFRRLKAGSHTLKVQPVNSAHMPAKGYKTIVVKFKTTA